MSERYVGSYEAFDEDGNAWEIEYWRETIEVRTRAGTSHVPGMQTLKIVGTGYSAMPDPNDKRKLIIPGSGKTLTLPEGFEPPW